mmetsp:Transcript_29418/g.68372  ORF Transcript_29418/g.68372 Transcript_29418/m.68372 type:complete len:280 (-) Transcript_29418:580-1419(-)
MVRGVQAREAHASDEAAPEVRAKEVRDQREGHHEHYLQEEQQLILLQADAPPACETGRLPALRGLRDDDPVDDCRPELHGQTHGEKHERDADDWRKDDFEEIKLPSQAEEHVEQYQGQDVVHKCGRDDGLPKLLLEHARLAKQPQRDANARGRQSGARRDALRHQWAPKRHHQSGPNNQGQNRPYHCDDASRDADDLRLFKIEVHAALKDHQRNSRMTDEREDVRCQTTVVVDINLAGLREALAEALIVDIAARQPARVAVRAVVTLVGVLLVSAAVLP